MTDSQWDEIFKKKLSGHESPVPEDMWERIILKKNKERKGFFFFFSLIGLFLLGLGIAGILVFNINKKGIVKEQQKISNSEVVPNAETAQSVTTDRNLAKASSLNKRTAYRRADTVLTAFRHKDHLKNTIPAGHRQAVHLQMQWKTKNKSARIGQMNSDIGSVTGLSEETVSKDTSKIAEDSSKLTDQKTNPAISSTPKLFTADSANSTSVKKQDPAKNIVREKWSLDLYASPDYLIDYAEEYVKAKLSYTVGLRVNRSFGKRFSGRIGIQFSELNYVLPDSSGLPGAYHLRRLDLPVLAGYSWGNETLGMTVNTGVIFNLNSWLRPDSIDYIKTNTGLSLYLGLNFSKHINERMEIFSEPYYRHQVSSLTVSTFNYLKFIDVAGISFGVRYHFKK